MLKINSSIADASYKFGSKIEFDSDQHKFADYNGFVIPYCENNERRRDMNRDDMEVEDE